MRSNTGLGVRRRSWAIWNGIACACLSVVIGLFGPVFSTCCRNVGLWLEQSLEGKDGLSKTCPSHRHLAKLWGKRHTATRIEARRYSHTGYDTQAHWLYPSPSLPPGRESSRFEIERLGAVSTSRPLGHWYLSIDERITLPSVGLLGHLPSPNR